jgi:hypothetical protein
MALDHLELSIMAFPQRWDGPAGNLQINFLLFPVGDPTAPLGAGPQFAGTSVPLIVNILAGLDPLPKSTSVPTQATPTVAQPPVVAPALFNTLFTQLVNKGVTVTSGKLSQEPPATARIQKSLPDSYTQAFPFEKPRTDDLSVGDGYGCSLRAQDPGLNNPPPPAQIAWGQILSYALRQPVLARNLGLVYSLTIPIPAGMLQNGGYVYLTLDASSPANPWVNDWQNNPDTVKSYAARLPQLDSTRQRSLFAATLFPVVANPGSNLTDAQFEAEQYDDGFAQIVHCNQPTTIDAVTLDPEQIAPGTEAGIQIGWDDEQVTVWLNNQIGLLHDRYQSGKIPNYVPQTPEAPLGVQGYRVDVRLKGISAWTSLCVVNGSLPFDQNSVGGAAITYINGNELWLAPAPIRPRPADPNQPNDNPAWLPLYFAQWRGTSLVVPDQVISLLAYAVANPGAPLPAPPAQNPSADLTLVPPLHYGNDYEFRVRLVDLTGGSALSTDPPVHPGDAPQALCKFRRFIPPKSLEVETSPPPPPLPAKPAPVRAIDALTVRRPRIGYPEALFAKVNPSTFSLANLPTLIGNAQNDGRAIDVADPDVDRFEVRVEARIPDHDIGATGTQAGDLDGNFRILYSLEVHFPTDQGDDPTVTLNLDYTDGIDDISNIIAPPDDTTDLPIPTARDIRVRLFPQCAARSNYYGTPTPPVGLSSDYIVRKDAVVEDALFTNTPQSQLQAFYFQPGSNIPQLLAQKLNLQAQGLTLSGAIGTRTVFGASGALRHTISPDGGSFTFSNATELLGHWIVVLVLDVLRDWTWDGFGQPALQFARGAVPVNIGHIVFPRVIPAAAVGSPGPAPDRSFSRIIFFDGLDPQPAPGSFPDELHPIYSVTASFDVAPQQQYNFNIELPITTPPAQTPKIASTGIAQTPYHHSDDYSETSLRDRYLWIEFDQPIADSEDDAYFGRVLAYGPDPLLAADLLPKWFPPDMLPDATEPDLPIDPEPMRFIFSGQAADDSGLDAMTQLLSAEKLGVGLSGKYFLLPLPPGISPEALDLFGFWTYEFRVGHSQKWSTAQGRYGRPLRVTGIQHPVPHLNCTIERSLSEIAVSAPYATTVYNGKRVYDFLAGDPQTSLWFMLYAQVLEADRSSYRNVLLMHREGLLKRPVPTPDERHSSDPQHSLNREPRGGTQFSEKEIQARLALLDLPKTTSLSVLAVEILPGQTHVIETDRRGVQPGRIAVDNEDPLGSQLGLRRILRTSPLTAVPAIC